MKYLVLLLCLLVSGIASADDCDVRLGTTIGLRVVEFASGNVIHSKMSVKDSTADAIYEEFVNLQDAGLCQETIPAKKCVLRFEKRKNLSFITFYRGKDRWVTWHVNSKKKAQDFVRSMKRVGFCS